ncbi:DUF5316 family protein [Bacillus sp. EAC]|uniref:DUF5316 family protein n=1 Tax=Bacillus sp. EAC TaxID=1978338 RepID=UPI001C4E33D8|nr:DUF5316 family protein [Bacillus sp. EAC]
MNLFILVGIIGVGLSGIVSGVFVSGDQQRANFHSETKEHRMSNIKFSLWTGVIGLISFLIAGIIYTVQKII